MESHTRLTKLVQQMKSLPACAQTDLERLIRMGFWNSTNMIADSTPVVGTTLTAVPNLRLLNSPLNGGTALLGGKSYLVQMYLNIVCDPAGGIKLELDTTSVGAFNATVKVITWQFVTTATYTAAIVDNPPSVLDDVRTIIASGVIQCTSSGFLGLRIAENTAGTGVRLRLASSLSALELPN